MSNISIGELNARVFSEIEPLAEYFTLEDVHRAVVSKLNVRVSFARQGSDINALLGKTEALIATDYVYEIIGFVGKGHPAWVEIMGGDGRYHPIRIVNFSQLESYAEAGAMACAFWAEDAFGQGSGDTLDQKIQFTEIPTNVFRIWYDMDAVRDRLIGNVPLPDSVMDLVVKEASNVLIKKAQLKLAMDLRRDEGMRRDAPLILQTAQSVYNQNILDIEPLLQLWKIWSFKDRSAQTNFNQLTPSSRGLYGDGFR